MKSFYALDEVLRERAASKRSYLEFLRVPTMSCGVYVLPAGSVDHQRPHVQAEVYFVISGEARMTVHDDDGEQDRALSPGDLILVKGKQPHRFHDITKELVVLVVFAPPEG